MMKKTDLGKRVRILLLFSAVVLLGATGAQAQDFSGVPGTVVHHVKLGSYWFSSSPSKFVSDAEILVLSNGNYIAAHALAGWLSGSASSGETSVFVSSDKGANWTALGSTLNGVLRGSLVEHGGALYLFGAQNDDGGKFTVWKSTNNGSTWTFSLFSGISGTATPNNPVVFNNRIWCAAGTASLSASETANLLLEASWMRKSGFPAYDGTWPSDGAFIGEGQIVASPSLGVHILPKVKDHALMALSSVDSTTGVVSFDPDHDFVEFPGGEKKFGVTYDAVSGRYFALSSLILPVDVGSADPNMIRNTAAMMSSSDLRNWNIEKIFLHSIDREQGFGYPNFDFDGSTMVIATRTAFKVSDGNDPRRAHDSNLLMFSTIADFRNAVPNHVLKLSGGDVLRYEKTQYQDAPLGTFALGSSFEGADLTNPNGFGKDANGDVYIRETGGRILRFDAAGNFIETGASSPVSFQTSELSVEQLTGSAIWTKSGSGDWVDLDNWYYWRRADTKEEIAVFGSAAPAAATVTLPSGFDEWTVKGLRFRSPNFYTLAGDTTLVVEAGSGNGSIEVQEGSHAVQMSVRLESDTDFHAAAGTLLKLSNELDLNGKALVTEGAGQLVIEDGTFQMNSGSLMVGEGSSVLFSNTVSEFSGTVEFAAPQNFNPSSGDSFHIIEGEAPESLFGQLVFPTLEEGLGWDTSALYTSGDIAVILKTPEAWMAQYGLPTDGSADFLDSDGDTQDNYSEWKAGTNPTNALSFFYFDLLGTMPVATGIQLRWNSLTNRTYRIEFGTNLMDNPAFALLLSGIPGEEGVTDFIDTSATNQNQGFYRVYVE